MTVSPVGVSESAWIAWVVSWVAAAFWSDKTARRPNSEDERVYRLFTMIGALLLFGVHPGWLRGESPLWRLPALAAWGLTSATVAGFAVAWWARLVLGRLWSSAVGRKANHRIIDRGPYHLVRHPIYFGIILSVLATAGMRSTLIAFVGAGLFIAGLWIKARIEERFLRVELGAEAYDAYARRVPMLIPFIGA